MVIQITAISDMIRSGPTCRHAALMSSCRFPSATNTPSIRGLVLERNPRMYAVASLSKMNVSTCVHLTVSRMQLTVGRAAVASEWSWAQSRKRTEIRRERPRPT